MRNLGKKQIRVYATNYYMSQELVTKCITCQQSSREVCQVEKPMAFQGFGEFKTYKIQIQKG